MDELTVNLNKLCYEFENSYYKDDAIASILHSGFTPQNILEASKLIRDKEKSRFLKLPLNFVAPVKARPKASIEELNQIAEAIYNGGEFKVALSSIELAGNEDIILKVLGPFSALFEAIDSNTFLKWLRKYKNEMHAALSKITEAQAAYINSAISKGADIISLAEPSAMAELIGEERYREFIIYYVVKLLKAIEASLDNSIVHICPRTSYQLERYGYAVSEAISGGSNSYGEALMELLQNKAIRFIGHRCINAENSKADKIYVLKLL